MAKAPLPPDEWTLSLPAWYALRSATPIIPVHPAIASAVDSVLEGPGKSHAEKLKTKYVGKVNLPPHADPLNVQMQAIVAQLEVLLAVRIHVVTYYRRALNHRSVDDDVRGWAAEKARRPDDHDHWMAVVGDYEVPLRDFVENLAAHLLARYRGVRAQKVSPTDLRREGFMQAALEAALAAVTVPEAAAEFRLALIRGQLHQLLRLVDVDGSASDATAMAQGILEWWMDTHSVDYATVMRWNLFAVLYRRVLAAHAAATATCPSPIDLNLLGWLQIQLQRSRGVTEGHRLADVLIDSPISGATTVEDFVQLVATRRTVVANAEKSPARVQREALLDALWAAVILPMLNRDTEEFVRGKASGKGYGETLNAMYPESEVPTLDYHTATAGRPQQRIGRRIAALIAKKAKAAAYQAAKAKKSAGGNFLLDWGKLLIPAIVFLVIPGYFIWKMEKSTDQFLPGRERTPTEGEIREAIDKGLEIKDGKIIEKKQGDPFNLQKGWGRETPDEQQKREADEKKNKGGPKEER